MKVLLYLIISAKLVSELLDSRWVNWVKPAFLHIWVIAMLFP